MFDFTDAGYPSTYLLDHEEVQDIFCTLTSHIQSSDADFAVIEIADGMYQRETSILVESAAFRSKIDRVIFAARDAPSAASGVEWLTRLELPVAGVSGMLSRSPLLCSEASGATGLPVLTYDELADPNILLEFLGSLGAGMDCADQKLAANGSAQDPAS